MTDTHEVEAPAVAPDLPARERSTAPQSDYTTREVGMGVAVFVAGAAVTFGVALALTL